jgi:hypothetical protein
MDVSVLWWVVYGLACWKGLELLNHVYKETVG